jgi:hypothetical protein
VSSPEDAAPGSWPSVGTWIIAPASPGTDWRIAAAALAEAAEVHVVVVVLGSPAGGEPARLLRARVDSYLQVGRAGTLDEAAAQVRALTRVRSLVLVAAAEGHLEPVGAGDWTLVDLAVTLRAPAVVITGPAADPVGDTRIVLDALAARGVGTSVVVQGDIDEAELPVTPAGRIAADLPVAAVAEPAPVLRPGRGRWVVRLLAVLATMLVVGGGLTWWRLGAGSSGGSSGRSSTGVGGRAAGGPATGLAAAPTAGPASPARVAGDPCRRGAGDVVPTRPDAATVARVDAAWTRIESWLAEYAPAALVSLRPAAGAAQIDDLQREMAVAFPADLVASLRRHDGATAGGFTLPPAYAPEPAARIVADWAVNCDALIDGPLIPFATGTDGARLLAGQGRVGEFSVAGGIDFDDWPGSVAALLERTAGSMETGSPDAASVDADGVLSWRTG